MIGKNNKKMLHRYSMTVKPSFSIRKRTIGTVSVLVASSLWLMSPSSAYAEEGTKVGMLQVSNVIGSETDGDIESSPDAGTEEELMASQVDVPEEEAGLTTVADGMLSSTTTSEEEGAEDEGVENEEVEGEASKYSYELPSFPEKPGDLVNDLVKVESHNTTPDEIDGNQSGQFLMNLELSFKEEGERKVKPNDYFEIQLSEYVNLNGDALYSPEIMERQAPIIYDNGKVLVQSKYDRENHKITYTFTDEVEPLKDIKANLKLYLYPNRETALMAKKYTLKNKVGNVDLEEKEVTINYDKIDFNSDINGSSMLISIDDYEDKFKAIIYMNPEEKSFTNAKLRFVAYNHYGEEPSQSGARLGEKLSTFEIYQVPQNVQLPDSYGVFPERMNIIKVTENFDYEYKQTTKGSTYLEIDFKNKIESKDRFVVIVDGTYDSSVGVITTTTDIVGKIPYYPESKVTVLNTNENFKNEAGGSGTVAKKPGGFVDYHVYVDVVKDFEGKVTSAKVNEDLSYRSEFQSGFKEQSYKTKQDLKEGYTFKETSYERGNPEIADSTDTVEGAFEEGIIKEVTYYYEKVKQPGRFEEKHVYQTKKFDGTIVTDTEIMTEYDDKNYSEGFEDEQFKTQAKTTRTDKDKDGYVLIEVKPGKEQNHAQDGSLIEENYIPGKLATMTYVYQRQEGRFVEEHKYSEIQLNFEGQELGGKLTIEQSTPTDGTEKQSYTTEKKVKDGFVLVENGVSSPNEATFNADGSKATSNYKPGVELKVVYEYEKKYQPGRFSEEHHYFVEYINEFGQPIDADGNIVEAGKNAFEVTEMAVTPKYEEEFPSTFFKATTKLKEGFKYRHNPNLSEKLDEKTIFDTNGDLSGDYVPGVHQKVIYNYYKTQQITTKGSFQEHHIYTDLTKDFNGRIIATETKVNKIDGGVSTGTKDQSYTTVMDDKGYKLIDVKGTNGAKFDIKGAETTGKYVPGEKLEVTYNYEKVKQPGRFSEEHHYHIIYVDEDGKPVDTQGNSVADGKNVVEQESLKDTPEFSEKYPGTNFAASIKEKDNFKYDSKKIEKVNFKNDTQVDEKGKTKGDYAPGEHQKVIYNYYKTQQVTTKGSFQEHHIYTDLTKDFNGKVIETATKVKQVDGKIFTGTKDESYTTSKKEENGFKFVKVEGSKEAKFDKDKGVSSTGNYIPGEALEVTYNYEQVKQPGRFSEEHHYFIVYVDEHGNPVDVQGNQVAEGQNIVEQEDLVDKPDYKEYYAGTPFSSVTKAKDAYVYDHTKTETEAFAKDTVLLDDGAVSGEYVPGIHQKVVYNYYKIEEVTTIGSFKENHEYFDITKDFEGNILDKSKNKEISYTSDPSTGRVEDIFTTVKDERDGYAFKKVTDASEGTLFDTNGEPTENHYVPGVEQFVTYEYEKVKQPGRFQDTHKYFVEYVDKDGNVVRTEERTDLSYVNKYQEGYRGEKQFNAKVNEKASDMVLSLTDKYIYRAEETHSRLLESQDYLNLETGSVKGDYLAGKLQEVTYHYYLQVSLEEPETEKPMPEEPEKPEQPTPEVPNEEEKPEVPMPETPSPEVPNEEERPEVPMPETPIPEMPNEGEKPEVPMPETPTPEVPNEEEKPEVPMPETPSPQTPEEMQPKPDEPQVETSQTEDDQLVEKQAALPETGEVSSTVPFGIGLVSLLSGLGFIRRKKD